MKNSTLFKHLLLFALLFRVASAVAQTIPPGFRQFTADDGLPSSEVYEVIQDSKGYLWFGTDNGVSRYNGYRFENFGAVNGLSNPVVFNLQEDWRGRIWMQTLGGKLFHFENDSIYAFAGNRYLESLPYYPDKVKGFYIDSTGMVYNSISEIGLIRCSENGDCMAIINDTLSLSIFQTENSLLPIILHNRACQNRNTSIQNEWKTSKIIPLNFLLKSGNYRQNIRFQHFDMYHINITKLKDGGVLVCIAFQLCYFKHGGLKWQAPMPENITFFEELKNGGFFIGFEGGKGARHYKSLNDILNDNYTSILQGLTVSGFQEDRDGGHWFTTTESGVLYQPNPSIKIYNRQSGFPTDYVTAIALKNKHQWYLGFDHVGISLFDSTTGKLMPLEYGDNRVFDLAYDASRQTLWAATALAIFFHKRDGTRLFDSEYAAQQKKAAYFNAKNLHFSHNDKFLWAPYHAGFNKIDLDKKEVVISSGAMVRRNLWKPTRTLDILTTASNHSYVANVNGLFEHIGSKLIPVKLNHPAFRTRIEALGELPDSTIVIGSKGLGLVFWKGDRIASLTEKDGLTANMLENLHIGEDGTIWAGTLNGLNKIRWRWDGQPAIESMTTAHGLPSNEINKVATWGNTVWVATFKGLAQFEAQAPNPASPTPMLASVLAGAKKLEVGKAATLAFDDNNLKINFLAINFKMNGHIPYRYRMDGGKWANTFNTSLDFPAMPYGDHHFEVQAQNENGAWSKTASYHFAILPPWYATWWFRGLVASVLAALAFGVYKYRTQQLQRENELQRQMTELERSALQAQMNPHFIFNCLNAIQHFIHQNDKEQAIEYLGSFARLVRGVLNASVTGRVTVEDEIRLLENYLALEQLRFDHRFDYLVKAEEGLEIADIEIPPLLVQPYVENAVLHGISGRESGGKVEVMFREVKGVLEINVSDNGPGINYNASDGTPKGHKSVGMGITQRRLELIGAKKNAATPVSLENIMDENGNILGARVNISVPI